VLACDVGFDRNHVETLQPYDLLYKEKDEEDLYNRLINLRDKVGFDYRSPIIQKYNPTTVMNKFKEVFL
jgi:hypothetical protein